MTRLRLNALRQMNRDREPSFPGSTRGTEKPCDCAARDRRNRAVAIHLVLFVVLFVGCGSGHYALEADKPKTAEEKAIAYLKSKGAGFTRIDQKYDRRVKEPYWRANLSGRLTDVDLTHLKQVKDLKYLSIDSEHISDDGLATIAELRQLKLIELVLYDLPRVTDHGIDKIADIATLKTLYLGPPQITDRAFRRFGRLRITRLSLGRLPNVTDRGMDHIADIATLEHLFLSNLNVTDRAFRRFGRLQELKSLNLSGIDFEKDALNVSDEALKFLKPLKRLEELNVGGTKVTDAGCAALAAMPALKELNLSVTAVGNQGVKLLSKSKSLEVLFLGKTRIDDGALKYIPAFQKLQRLSIPDNKITDEGLKHLRKARLTSLDLYAITIKNQKITDRGLRYVQEMKTLKRLKLYMPGTGITEQGLDRLRRARPDLALIIIRRLRK